MSKRGRRRSSRRRKSSSSSKQSVSPYIFHKQNQNNSLSYKDDVVEKGQVDSLRKENAPSGSEDEEKYNHAPPKEKRFKQDYDSSSVSSQRSIYTKTTEDTERGVKIVTSVSVDEDLNPKITFQQSHQPLSDNQTSPSTPVTAPSTVPITNIMNINCSGSHIKLEIQEFQHTNASGIKTTFVLMNQKMNSDGTIYNVGCQRTWTPNNDYQRSWTPNNDCQRTWSPNNESHPLTNHSSNYRFVFGQSASISPDQMWSSPEQSQKPQKSEFMPEKPPLTPPPVFRTKPSWKRKHFQKSFSVDEFWDIPPPREFADIKLNLLDELTQDLSSCRISDDQKTELCPPQVIYEDDYARVGRSPSFDQVSEPDSFNPSLFRPSLSTNRSSFTKDFISSQQRRSWIRNNSIAAVQHRACSLPKKRRQTYPWTSGGLIQDQGLLGHGAESFSSLMTGSEPQRSHLIEDGVFDQRAESLNSLMAKESPRGLWEIPYRPGLKHPLFSPFYTTSSEDAPDDSFAFKEANPGQSGIGYCPRNLCQRDFMPNVCPVVGTMNDEDGIHKTDHDIADSGFDQEMGEVDYPMVEVEDPSLDPPTEDEEEELSRRSLMIQVIPPSCSGSEEHILNSGPADFFHGPVNNPNQQHLDVSSPGLHGPQGMTVPAAALQQRLLQVDSMLSPSSCLDKHLRTCLADSCMDSLNLHQDKEQTEPERTGTMFTLESAMAEETDNQPSGSALNHVEGSTESREELSQACRMEKHMMIKSSLEAKDQLKPVVLKEADCSGSDHWAKRRKLFRESKQWSSAAGSSITSDITEESVSEESRSMDLTTGDGDDRGFYTETFHSSAWIFQGDEVSSGSIPPSLNTRTRAVSVRERTVRINKGTGEYPWGFRIQFSKPIVVTEVDTNGAAEEAGLIVGDYVLAVNGTDVTSIPHSEAADLARQGPDILTLTIGSDIARCPNTPRPACRGYLHKRTQSGLIKGWRKRWFVLTHDCCLYYYRHKRDEGKRRALSAMKLEGAEVGPDVSLGKPFVFKCQPQTGNRVFFFCATSNQEMKRWLEAMERAVHPITQKHVWVDVTRHNSSLPPLAVKNPECLGLLHKMDRSRDMWVQHYCILKDGCLLLYSGIRATHARGGIYLQGYAVREQPYGSKKSTIELKPPSDEFKTFYLSAEDPNENKRWIIALKASIKKWLPLHRALQDYMNRLPEETRM